jgi:hypothetical protein
LSTPSTKQERQASFLAVFSESIYDTEACEKAGISKETLYRWLREDESFAVRVQELEAGRARNLESSMLDVLRWATLDEARYEKLLRYPALLMFAIRGALPDKYGERATVGADDAKKIIDELLRMRDDPTVKVTDGLALEDKLDRILPKYGGI